MVTTGATLGDASGGKHGEEQQQTRRSRPRSPCSRLLKYGDGYIETGWKFANGAAKSPDTQYCHYKQFLGEGSTAIQNVGVDGKQLPSPTNVIDQSERFTHCQWFNGDLG